MVYTYLSAHAVQGLVHQPSKPDFVLFADAGRGLQVLLTSDAPTHLRLLSRQTALFGMMLTGGLGEPIPEALTAAIEVETDKVARQWQGAIGVEPVVLIKIDGQIDVAIPDQRREINDFILCFDAFDKKALRQALKSKVSAILTGLRLGVDDPLEFRLIADGAYMHADDGRILYSATAEFGSMSVFQSRPVAPEQRPRIAQNIGSALSAGSLERVMRLHSHSLNRATDSYRSFLSAWSALEILVGKLFPIYQKLLRDEMRSVNRSPGTRAYLDRIEAVVGDKFKLSDKFSVLSIYLDGNEDELRRFQIFKEVRDQLTHGQDVEDATLPTRDVQRLFDKYLRNHMARPPGAN